MCSDLSAPLTPDLSTAVDVSLSLYFQKTLYSPGFLASSLSRSYFPYLSFQFSADTSLLTSRMLVSLRILPLDFFPFFFPFALHRIVTPSNSCSLRTAERELL